MAVKIVSAASGGICLMRLKSCIIMNTNNLAGGKNMLTVWISNLCTWQEADQQYIIYLMMKMNSLVWRTKKVMETMR